jgi:quercetin dioxygenase-like cupin family protein
MKNILISMVLLFVISCTGSKEKFLYPEVVSPEVYKVLLDNEDVKVLEVTFDVGKGDKMHDHDPVTFYVLQGGKARVTMPDGTVNERQVPTGFTGHNSEAQRHQVTNIGDDQIKILLIERKRSESSVEKMQELILPEEVSPEVYKVLLENDDVKVLEVTFAPGQSDLMHEHGVLTYYGIKGGKLQNTLPDGTVREMEAPDGFVGHGDKIVKHQMKNVGTDTARFILVEHKKLLPVSE